jgi:hypothetical protein
MKSANGASTSGKQVKAKSPKKATKCKVNLNGQGLYEWHTSVTAAMARRSKPQVLVSYIQIYLYYLHFMCNKLGINL